MRRVDDIYFAMAFYFGFTPKQVDEMDADTAMRLMEGLKRNSSAAGMRALAKGMGL
jgi:hypothetical protein